MSCWSEEATSTRLMSFTGWIGLKTRMTIMSALMRHIRRARKRSKVWKWLASRSIHRVLPCPKNHVLDLVSSPPRKVPCITVPELICKIRTFPSKKMENSNRNSNSKGFPHRRRWRRRNSIVSATTSTNKLKKQSISFSITIISHHSFRVIILKTT